MKIDWNDFDAVLFDLDGTLVNSMGMWKRVDVIYLGGFGLDVPEDLQKALEGLSYNQTAVYFKKRFGIRQSTDEIKQIWHELAKDQYRTSVPLKDGARELLAFLHERGIKTAIASSNSHDLIVEAVRAHGLEDAFDLFLACDEVTANKPDPSVYLTAAKKLGADPARCLVFEDIPVGIEAGLRAGMKVFAVDDDYSADVEKTKKEMADGYIRDFFDVLPGRAEEKA